MTIEEIERIINFVENRYFHTPSYLKVIDDDMRNLISALLFLLSEVKRLQSELSKWTATHEDSNLQDMKEQSDQKSLSAKQAYINALEWRVKHLEKEIERFRPIVETMTKTLSGKTMSKIIEDNKRLQEIVDGRKEPAAYWKRSYDEELAHSQQAEEELSKVQIEKQIFERCLLDGDDRIDELKVDIKRIEDEREHLSNLLFDARFEIVRLREGIERHRDAPVIFYRDCSSALQQDFYSRDEELYGLLEGEGK
jgi:chromosome segregation ATPase